MQFRGRYPETLGGLAGALQNEGAGHRGGESRHADLPLDGAIGALAEIGRQLLAEIAQTQIGLAGGEAEQEDALRKLLSYWTVGLLSLGYRPVAPLPSRPVKSLAFALFRPLNYRIIEPISYYLLPCCPTDLSPC